MNFKKLALLLLPTNFRMPMVTALFYAVMTPFNSLQVRFKQYRDEVYYALTHKPQTCHLQAVLNDEFDFEQRRITVSDIKDKPQVLTVYKRSEMSALLVPVRGWEYEEWSEGLHFMLVTRRGYGGAQGVDFSVNINFAMSVHERTRLEAITDKYKIASKRYLIK